MEAIVLSVNASGVRRENLEGRPHLVVPTVMIVEGVLKGSNGPLLYTRVEMGKKIQSWDHRPVVYYHPTKNGKPASAASAVVLNTQKIGILLNTTLDQKTGKRAKLKTESWIDIEKAGKIAPGLIERIEKGEPVEVSTGLFTENEAEEGTFNGKKYTAVAKEYVPDHLAILPDEKGASSIEDGAGLNMNAEGMKCSACGGKMCCPSCEPGMTGNREVVTNAMSYTRTHQLLQKGLDDKYGKWQTSVMDVYPGFVVYGKRNGEDYKLLKHDYKMDNRRGEESQIVLKGDPAEVERITEYRTPDGEFVGNELYGGKFEDIMTKEQLVESIIANSGGTLDGDDKEWLLKKKEEWLRQLPRGKAADTSTQVQNTQQVEKVTGVKIPTFQELIANADSATRDMIQEGLASRAAERTKMIQTITANSQNKFKVEELERFDTLTLRNLAALASPKEEKSGIPNYAGAGGFAPTVNQGTDRQLPTLPMPTTTRPQAK